jgi:hypothetical protein
MSVALLMTYKHWIILLVFLGLWRLLQDYVTSPRIMGKSMELHPLAAIFGVMAGGEIAGILGIFLSIPVMASLRIVFRRWRLYAEKRKFGPLNQYSFGSEIVPRKEDGSLQFFRNSQPSLQPAVGFICRGDSAAVGVNNPLNIRWDQSAVVKSELTFMQKL